jgi:hypothetical protein
MRKFIGHDGREWTARVHEGSERIDLLARVGWDLILFTRSENTVEQRFVYRPNGWLQNASEAQLQEAVEEAEAIRATWGAPPR